MQELKKYSELVRDIYQLAFVVPIDEFKLRCFELLADTFQIQSGTWITRCERQIPFYEQDSFTYQLPDGFMEDYHHLSTVSTQVHQVFGVMLGNLDKTLDILDVVPEDEWFGSDMYKLYCEKFDLHHSLMTVTANPLNEVINIVTFARHDPDHPFSEEEKLGKEFVVPNLVEAMRINILNAFSSKQGDASAYRAVSDRYGNLIEAEEGFLALVEKYQLVEGRKLLLNIEAAEGVHQTNDYQLVFENNEGLVYLELKAVLVELLTGRKADVSRLLLSGLSNKEIAQKLQIAPNTVSNHLKEVFRILNVNKRHQAISLLMRQPL